MKKISLRTSTFKCLAHGLVSFALISSSAWAANHSWVGSAGSTDWATAANWVGGVPTNGVSTLMFFTGSNASASNTLTNTLTTSAFIVGNITFDAGAPSYTLTGNAFRLNANGVAGNGIINNSGVLQTFQTPIFFGNDGSISGSSVSISELTNFNASRTLTNNVNNGSTLTISTLYLSNAIGTARILIFTGSGNTLLSGTIANASGGAGTASGLTFNSSYTGTATINGTNTYSGTTTLSAGAIVVGNNAAFGTSVVGANGSAITASSNRVIANTVNFGGTNTFFGSSNIELSGTVTSTGSRILNNNLSGTLSISNVLGLSSSSSNHTLTINGSGVTDISGVVNSGTGGAATPNLVFSGTGGTLILSGSNTYGGTTTVNAGTLIVRNTAGSATSAGTVTVGNAAALQGNGTIAGNLTVSGTLAPGISSDSTTTLNLNGNVVMAGTTKTFLDITGTGAGAYDVIANDGDAVTFDGDLTLTLSGSYGVSSWTLFSGFNTYGGTFDSVTLAGSYAGALTLTGDLWQGTIGGNSWEFNEATGVLSTVPEPSAVALLALGLGAIYWRSKVRRQRRAG